MTSPSVAALKGARFLPIQAPAIGAPLFSAFIEKMIGAASLPAMDIAFGPALLGNDGGLWRKLTTALWQRRSVRDHIRLAAKQKRQKNFGGHQAPRKLHPQFIKRVAGGGVAHFSMSPMLARRWARRVQAGTARRSRGLSA